MNLRTVAAYGDYRFLNLITAIVLSLALHGLAWADSGSVSAANDSTLSAHRLLRQADLHGERQVLRSLSKDARQWRQLLRNITSGEKDWVFLGARLLAAAEGSNARELQIALEDALIAAPRNVLAVVGPNFVLIGLVCGRSAHQSHDLSANSLSERMSAVLTLQYTLKESSEKVLVSAVDQCAETLLSENNEELKQRTR